MKRQLCLVAGVGLAVIAATAWKLSPARPTPDEAAAFQYLHCPSCEKEGPYSPVIAEEFCPRCEKRLVPTVASIKKGGKPASATGKMFAVLYAEAVALLAAVWFVTRPRDKTDDVDYLHFRCPKCKQKLRYREAQVGQAGACPRCKTGFVFPAEGIGDEEDAA